MVNIFALMRFAEVVVPDEPSMDWKEMTDRAANKVFFLELAKGNWHLELYSKDS